MADSAKLSALPAGKFATIASLPHNVPGLTRLREMGILPGTRIQLIRRAPLGDPIEIAVRGSLLSLRLKEAELIEIRPEA